MSLTHRQAVEFVVTNKYENFPLVGAGQTEASKRLSAFCGAISVIPTMNLMLG
jgi:hypothetical protein